MEINESEFNSSIHTRVTEQAVTPTTEDPVKLEEIAPRRETLE